MSEKILDLIQTLVFIAMYNKEDTIHSRDCHILYNARYQLVFFYLFWFLSYNSVAQYMYIGQQKVHLQNCKIKFQDSDKKGQYKKNQIKLQYRLDSESYNTSGQARVCNLLQ